LSFEEKFYIGQSKSFDYYNNIYYADDVIKRKIKVFNKLPEEKEEEPEENLTSQTFIHDTTLSLKEKLFILAFAVLIVLNLSWDFIRAKTRVDEVEEDGT
jgi:predicted glutamine amidotransferase